MLFLALFDACRNAAIR